MKKAPTLNISKSSPSLMNCPSEKLNKHRVEKQSNEGGTINNRKMIPNNERIGHIQRKPYFIVEDGLNSTPKPLQDSLFPSVVDKTFMSLRAMKHLGVPRSSRRKDELESLSSYSLFTRMSAFRRSSTIRTSTYTLPMTTPSDASLSSIDIQSDDESELGNAWEDRAPSMFRLREDPPPRKTPIVTSFTVNLTETEIIFHLQLQSEAASLMFDQGKMIAESNSLYHKNAQSSKSKTDTATQTARVFKKHNKMFLPHNQRANASAFASVWDIYDCYLNMQNRIKSLESEQLIMEEQNMEETQDEDKVERVFEYEGHQFNSRFLEALIVLERLIQQKTYSEKQILYQGLLVQDPLSIDVACDYTLTLLWTFKSELTKNRKVTSMCWSSKIHNILAVGYGKLKYTDNCNGLVCIWNVKNPQDPEIHFSFKDPVTYVNFSRVKAQILAVSFYSGLVLMLDITNKSLVVKATNQNYPLYYPVWQVHWFSNEDNSSSLSLVTCGKNGRIYKYKKTKFFTSKKLVSIGRPYGNIQGVELPRKCYVRKTLACQNPSAEVLVRHPKDPLIYLVGTSEGYVYTCSINHRHDHIDVFVAHHGPVYTIQFNPFCSKVFLTCGADWCIRIWAETIYEPLITLESGMATIYSAAWNPLNSTIIVSTTGHFLEVWDIRRKVTGPKSTTESPSRSFNTVLRFTENKYNVSVGDADGNVHIMALTKMPFSPTFQEEILTEAILNMLISQPDLQHKLRQLGPPFTASDDTSYRATMYRKLNNLHRAV